jgi:hypothetical protein
MPGFGIIEEINHKGHKGHEGREKQPADFRGLYGLFVPKPSYQWKSVKIRGQNFLTS